MAYTYSQLEQIWISNGGSPAAAPMAAAIAMAESKGNPGATDYDKNGSVDRGLWQINSVWGALSTYSVGQNAKSAIYISDNGQDWSPWVTYQTGAYKQYLNSSTTPGGLTQAQLLSAVSAAPTPQPGASPAPGGGAQAGATSSTSAGASSSSQPSSTASEDADCLARLPVPFTQGICLSKTWARVAVGGLVVAVGTIAVMLGGFLVIYAVGTHTRAGRQAAQGLRGIQVFSSNVFPPAGRGIGYLAGMARDYGEARRYREPRDPNEPIEAEWWETPEEPAGAITAGE